MSKTAKKKPTRGRPVGTGKISPEIITTICKGIEAGMTQEAAAASAGINKGTFYIWRKKGEEARSGIYYDFFNSLDAAQKKVRGKLEKTAARLAVPHQVKTVKEVFHPKTSEITTLTETKTVADTTLLKFILERRWPEDWGKKDKLDLTTDGNPFEMPMFGSIMGQGEKDEE